MTLDGTGSIDNRRQPAVIAVRLQHAKLAASGLLTDEPGRTEAKATIVTEVERLHWRIWNGKAKNAQRTFDRIRKVMHLYKE